MGRCYLFGYGTNKDWNHARINFEKSLLKTEGYSETALGYIYQIGGFGIEKNLIKAKALFESGMNQGNYSAVGNLGVMYHNGYGCIKNIEIAKKYYKMACEHGEKNACENLKVLEDE